MEGYVHVITGPSEVNLIRFLCTPFALCIHVNVLLTGQKRALGLCLNIRLDQTAYYTHVSQPKVWVSILTCVTIYYSQPMATAVPTYVAAYFLVATETRLTSDCRRP